MKNIIIAATTAFVFMFCSNVGAAISVSGAASIKTGDYVEIPVVVDGCADCSVKIASGKLPYGLRLIKGKTISGIPVAVEKTSVVFEAEGQDGAAQTSEIEFLVSGEGFRLLYAPLPVAPTGKTTSLNISGTGGAEPYGGCAIKRVRTFRYGGAAVPGMRAPSVDEAPSWLTLSNSCELTATPDEDALVLMVISATDAAGAAAEEFYVLRSAADPAATGWVEAKAREYNKDYQERFSPYGITLEIDSNGAYHEYGDSAMWTGTYLGGAAYYYAVTREPFAEKSLKKALAGTTKLREITGVPGLIARGYELDESAGKRDEPYIKINPADNSYLVEEGKYKGWRFRGTASRDQFTGVLWGNATVYDLFDEPELSNEAAANILSMATHIWDNEMHIVDVDGKPTRHGIMSGYGLGESGGPTAYDPYTTPARISNGFNAMMILNWFNMAATTAPDDKTRELWRTRIKNLISKNPNPEPGRSFERSYIGLLDNLYVYGISYNSYWDTVWFNLNLLFNNYFHLIRFEKHDKLREKYRSILATVWDDRKEMENGCEDPEKRRAGREGNPHFTWQYLAAKGDREPDKIFNAVSEMVAFPKGPRAPFDIIEPMEFERVTGHEEWTCEPVPIQYRKTSDFQWQRSPYRTNSTWPSDGIGRNFPGVDMITPYWMGRYFGYIPDYM